MSNRRWLNFGVTRRPVAAYVLVLVLMALFVLLALVEAVIGSVFLLSKWADENTAVISNSSIADC